MPFFDYIGGYRYHVVFVTNHRLPHFKAPRWATFAENELARVSAANAFLVEAFCVMPDHIHALLRGDADMQSDLTKFSHAFKQSVGYRFRQSEGLPLWHRSYYDHVLRPDEPAIAHAAYILGNPVRAGLVDVAAQWAYSGPATVFSEIERADRSEDLSLRADAVAIQMGELFTHGEKMQSARKVAAR